MENFCLSLHSCKGTNHDSHGRGSKPVEKVVFCFVVLVFLLGTMWLYCWSIIGNSYDSVNLFFFEELQSWFHWYLLLLCLTIVALIYISVMLLSACVGVLVSYPLHLHLCHKIVVVFCGVVMVAGFILVDMFWQSEFQTVAVSFQIIGPFLQLCALFLWTLFSLYLSKVLNRLPQKNCIKYFLIFLYVTVFIFLCSIPLWFYSPCIASTSNRKPLIIAHRGASAVRPENTIMAFQKAAEHEVWGFETDVRLSADGIPFLMHDPTLLRTTNVDKIFPTRKKSRPESFTWNELRQLNAGQWFLNTNPFFMNHWLNSAEKQNISKEKIPSFQELLEMTAKYNKSIIFDLTRPPSDHLNYENWINVTVQTIFNSSIPQESILWHENLHQDLVSFLAPGFKIVARSAFANASADGISYFNLEHNTVTSKTIEYGTRVIDYTVNDMWMYSRSWCLGMWASQTDLCHVLNKAQAPVWTMPRAVFLGVWLSLDLLAMITVFTVSYFNCHTLKRHSDRIQLEPVEGSYTTQDYE